MKSRCGERDPSRNFHLRQSRRLQKRIEKTADLDEDGAHTFELSNELVVGINAVGHSDIPLATPVRRLGRPCQPRLSRTAG